jgi:bifunctional non-homologous end joining protein LigD
MINGGANRIVLRCISVVSTLLKKLIADTDVQFSESFEFDGQEMFKHACGVGLEGVASQGPGQPVLVRPQQRLGEKDMRPPAPDAANLRFCAEGKFDGIYLGSPSITT